MKTLQKLSLGDKVAVVSPSSAAPGRWPHVHEFGLERLRNVFGLEGVEYPSTRDLEATPAQKSRDLEAAFADPQVKAVVATLGGDIQVTYVKNLAPDVFLQHPKPFFGYSDNSHFANFLFLNGIPSYYGAALFTQFAMQGAMDDYTVKYIKHALFDGGEIELLPAKTYNDIGLFWDDPALLQTHRQYEPNDGWFWDGSADAAGLLWGGCVESVDEMLRHDIAIPSLSQFESIVLMLETSEEMAPASYVFRVIRGLGERGILARVRGVLMGRPKAWEFHKPYPADKKAAYRQAQRQAVLSSVRDYNQHIPVIQNLDFGHTDPQIPMPYGGKVRVIGGEQRIWAEF
jgi:muramoyltetrapeptide carboxypeptidase LdcA involved in peptidoglycan recycling